ncbi:MAG: hypothetical protein FWC77_02140 [Defluviitaleaceae bacterium]|nr:hypothetical protein [Defluviitaleaceae bacterium]
MLSSVFRLDKQVVSALQKGELDGYTVRTIREEVEERRNVMQRAFWNLTIFTTIIAVLLILQAVLSGDTLVIVGVILSCVGLAASLVFYKLVLVGRMQKQFDEAVKIGYPNGFDGLKD